MTPFPRLFSTLTTFFLVAIYAPAVAQNTVPKPTPEVQALLDNAKTAMEKGDFKESLAIAERALVLSKERKDRAGEGIALRRVGIGHDFAGHRDEALGDYLQACEIAKELGDKLNEVWALINAGGVYQSAGKVSKALECFQEALRISNEAGDKGSRAHSLLSIGIVSSSVGRMDEALDYYQQAVTLFKEIRDKRSEGLTYNNIGLIFATRGRTQQALEYFESSLAAYRAAADKAGEANALSSIAWYYNKVSEYDRSEEYCLKALDVFSAIGDKERESVVLGQLGDVYSITGQADRAIEAFEKALQICLAIGNKPGEAGKLNALGIVFSETGRPRLAGEHYQRALAIYRATGSKAGEATVLNRLGILYSQATDYQRALECYSQALTLERGLGRKGSEAFLLYNIGNVYQSTGQSRRAIEFYKQSEELHRVSGDKRGEAMDLMCYGVALLGAGLPKQSRLNLEKALLILKLLGDRRQEVYALQNLSFVVMKAGEPQKALEYLAQALPISKALGDRRLEGAIHRNIAEAYERVGQPAKSIEANRRALSIARAAIYPDGEASALYGIGKGLYKQGRLAEAESSFKSAVSILEQMRSGLGGYSAAKIGLLADKQERYRDYLDFLLARGKAKDAFALAQKIKARSLLDLLASGRVDLNSSLTPEERMQVEELQQEANSLNAEMVKEGVENEIGSKRRYAGLKERLRGVEGKLQLLTDALYARHPGLALKRAARTVSLDDVSKFLPIDTALLDYVAVSKDEMRLFVVTMARGKSMLHSYPIRARAELVSKQAAAFHSACGDPRKEYRVQAASLYRLLMRPAERVISTMRRLIICPDGALWDIPFAALSSSHRSTFLGTRYETVYAYSATGAQAALVLASKRSTTPKGSILVCANPEFGSSARFGDLTEIPGQRPIDAASRPIDTASRPIDSASRPLDAASRPIDLASRALDTISKGATGIDRGNAIRSLPGTQREAESLLKLFPSAVVLTGTNAQESTVKEQAGKYRYLHFATHGFVNDGSPLLSSVVMATPSKGSKEDGFLTAREIYRMNLNAEMTVLSACNTARGENRTGEGVIGLTWALFVAGCPTQVVSQWAVDDASTAMLMGQFYENLKVRKMGKAQALTEAESWLRKQNPKYRHPYYWAPFVLNGAWK
jgi:CHAT domain-containing protein/Tfp pilus assembly protein PilF